MTDYYASDKSAKSSKSGKSRKSRKSAKSKKSMKIPKRDIKTLLEDPSSMSKKYFDEVYGDGAADTVLKSAKVGGRNKKTCK
tara:strand:- start:278 stop:523 length:246 start_codon:yes stop_codon:yes gene_type:complete